MVRIHVESGTSVHIVGHGIRVESDFELAPGVTVSPATPTLDGSFGSRSRAQLLGQMAALFTEGLADFSLLIEHERGGKDLATKAWNALWTFSLLALAGRTPVMPLYSKDGGPWGFSPVNRNIIITPLPQRVELSGQALKWARENYDRYEALLEDDRFRSAQRCLSNAHYLFDNDIKVMLLWAGIEGILDVDAELRRRIALHAAILYDGNREEKAAYYAKVKKSYDTRSRVVHGTGADASALEAAYLFASEILVNLLRKMAEFGRVPLAAELDELAASGSLN